jgi:phosphoglycolate phosphatase-like HAD superfamily hydrolase
VSAPVRAVLFDLDGTLADSEHIAVAALSAAFAEADLDGDPPLERFLAMSGMALEEILARLGLPAELAGPFRTAARRMTSRTRLFPGALSLLRVLRARSVRVGVITGKDKARTLATLDHLQISGLIDAVVTPDDPPAPKPSPEGVWWLGTGRPTCGPARTPGYARWRACGAPDAPRYWPGRRRGTQPPPSVNSPSCSTA